MLRSAFHTFSILLLILAMAGCKSLTSPVDVPTVSIPQMRITNVQYARIDTDTLNGGNGLFNDLVTDSITVTVFAFDSTGISGVAGRLSSPDWVFTNQPATVLANFPFSQISDSVWRGTVSFQIFRYEVGTYLLWVQTYNTAGIAAVPVNYSVQISYSKNHPPVIDSVWGVPDTLKIGTGITSGSIHAKVSDPEGWFDLYSVFATVTLPDGTTAPTQLQLFDDGLAAHADDFKADGVFSIPISFDPNATPAPLKGKYVYHFVASDKSGATATDSLTIVVQ
jgi:hypothetical protein